MEPLPYRQIKRKLEKAGFTIIHQPGSHVKFVRESEVWTVIVPNHREVRVGILRTILRHADLTLDEFD